MLSKLVPLSERDRDGGHPDSLLADDEDPDSNDELYAGNDYPEDEDDEEEEDGNSARCEMGGQHHESKEREGGRGVPSLRRSSFLRLCFALNLPHLPFCARCVCPPAVS